MITPSPHGKPGGDGGLKIYYLVAMPTSEEDFKMRRSEEIRKLTTPFLRQVAMELAAPQGLDGNIDIAFQIDRLKIVAEEMVSVGKSLLKEYGHGPK